MNFFLIYIIYLFSTCSLFAGRGAELREAVYQINLTEALKDQIKQDIFVEFENSTDAYAYLPECTIFPMHWKKYRPLSVSKNQSQEKLREKYGNKLSQTCGKCVLKSGATCISKGNTLYIKMNIKDETISSSLLAVNLYLPKPIDAWIETDNNLLVILYKDGEIEERELFDRNVFCKLSLKQLIVLVNLSKNVDGCNRSAHIHSDWYEIFKTIPNRALQCIFGSDIYVSAHGRPEDFHYMIYVDSSKELEPHIKELQSVFNNQDKSNSLAIEIESENKQISSEEREDEEKVPALELPPVTTLVNNPKPAGRTTKCSKPKSKSKPQQAASKNLGAKIPKLPQR